MPLYTYVITYKTGSYVAQGSHSNFNGFISSWCSELPDNVLPGFNSSLKNELGKKAYHSAFSEVPNRKNVWCKSIDLSGSPFVIYAIQTQT